MTVVDEAATARRHLLAVLHGRSGQLASELIREAKARDRMLTFGQLQKGLAQLIAGEEVQVDERLRISETSKAR